MVTRTKLIGLVDHEDDMMPTTTGKSADQRQDIVLGMPTTPL